MLIFPVPKSIVSANDGCHKSIEFAMKSQKSESTESESTEFEPKKFDEPKKFESMKTKPRRE